jgi:hypothetical protein
MKRLLCAIAVMTSFAGGAVAKTSVPDLPECRGVVTKAIVAKAKSAKSDPAVAYAKTHRGAAPAKIRCTSALWNAFHNDAARKRAGLSPAGAAAAAALGAVQLPPAPFGEPPYAGPPGLSNAHAVRTPPLRKVTPIPPGRRGEGGGREVPEPVRPAPPADGGGPEGPIQTAPGAPVSAPTATGVSFDGVGVGLSGFSPSSNPPDVEGHVGATQYVQFNNTSFAIFDKTGTLLYGPAAGKTLWQSLGGACASHNDGDPMVNYDILSGRWILSQFVVGASPSFSHQCFAVSLTGDATGAYYLYDFITDATNFIDYPHIGVWPDGYYMSAHVYNAAGTSLLNGRLYVFERSAMINGQTARMQSVDLAKDGSAPQYGFLPADVDSLTPPPAGAQAYVIGPNRQFTNRTNLWRIAVTWGATPTITATKTTNATVGIGNAPCVSNTVAQQNRDCVPQLGPGGGANVPTDDLDNLSSHYMNRLAYMNHGGTESLIVTSLTNGAATTPAHGTVKWMEWRGSAGNTAPTLFQSGTYDPTSTQSDYRWMSSGAMDKAGNIAIGYSRSSNTTKPGIWITGRLSTDTVGTMGAETQIQAGGGVQIAGAGSRWGDYTSLTLDPVDQCTFWYTNEYLKADGAFNWSTRIASYKFPSCTPDTSWGTLSGTITSCATGAPLSGVLVQLSNGFAGTTDASGNYSIRVPNGTYTVVASDSDRACSTGSPATVDVNVPANGTASQNFCMTGSSNLQYNAVAVDDSLNGNNNGKINSNECANLNVTLKNNGCANESAISATLTTATAGVTVTQGSSTYPNMVIDASGVNATPFKIQTSNSFVCGTIINFTLNVTYASGNKAIAFSVPTCVGGPNQSIPASSIALTDPSQPDRMARDGSPSTCSAKACPGAINTAGTRNYKTFNFTNNGGAPACFTVTINASCGANDVQSAAYLNSYTPPTAQGDAAGNLCLGYLGDSGISGLGSSVPSSSYSFTVPALSNFVIVVNTATGSTTCPSFSGTVSGFYDFTPGPGACPACTPPPTPTITPAGPTTFCSGGSVTLNSSAASGNQWYLNGSAIGGATGTSYAATASGSYTVTATASSCTSPQSSATTVTVNPIPSTPSASNTGPYCAGATISLSTPTVSGATYSWTGSNGFTSALQNPTRANAAAADAGTYSVTVTVNGCTSAAGTTSVVVNPIPATPTASNTGPYCAGATISLSTPTVAGATYSWTGPNGFTSALQNPTRANATTADAGTYSVTITVSGCTSAAGTTSVVVNPTPATPTASNGGPYCAGATISLSTPTVASATYAWTGPNGFTSALQNPTRANATTADAGTYSVTVTVSGCTSAAGTTSVVVNPTPATPTASNGGPYCAGGTISLSTPTVAGATYSWTGPNGFTSALQNPTRSSATTADAGTYSVTVTVSGCTSAAGTTSVVVNPTPATPTASNGGPYCAGATISLSTPTVASATYSWTGPNGFTSALQNPTRANATTADAGTYSVTITVSGCTSAAGTTDVVVNPTPATPTASNGGPYCEGATISLSTPTVAGATYSWTGPNGFTSALQNPTRANATTADAGTYSVTVTVAGCTSAAGTTSVVVNPTPATPTATNGGPYCEGATIALFTPAVAGATYSWSGPNGFTSTAQNPTRPNSTVADAGTYAVTITVSGCTSAAGTTSVIINPAPATPTASNGGPYCAGATISLSTPTVSGATYSWTGPNGFTSTSQNPTRSNATTADAGTYSVTITVDGCPSAAGTTDVVVNATPATPTASNGGPYCAGATIALSTPFVSGATYSWTGPNGFTSALQNPTRTNATTADAGTYSVTVTVSGCTSAAGTTNVVVNATPATPTASNGGPYCEGGTISLSTATVAGATYSWTGPNGFTSALQNPTRANATTADAGTYSVTITVSGCTSAAGTTSVVVNPTPATPTASNGGPYCAGATISLSTPTVAGATYAWTGPNGFTSALQNPTRANATTADAGTYSVTVTVSGCTSAAGTTSVVVNAIPATPTASNGGPYCAGATISLSTPTVASATYSWTGPNGFTSALQNPTRSNATTADAGTYSVTVTVSGCTSAAGTTSVVVNPTPATPTASNGGPYCEGATISLSTATVAGATYSWTGPNGFTSALQNPTRTNATTADAGTYSVTITAAGCTSAAGTTDVVVSATPATPTATNGGPYCEGATIALFTPTVAGATYAWTGPNGFTSTDQNPTRPNATVADAGTYSVTVTVGGCTSAAGTTSVIINPAPATPTASNGGPYCEGATISLSTPTVSGATYSWTGPNGFTSTDQNPTRSNATTADAGTYSVTITVDGCPSAAGTTDVVVNATPATPTASNGGPYCTGATIALSTPFVSGATYAWTGPNGFTSALQNPTRTNATTADAGTYSVTITVNGCTSAAGTTNVVVNATPATPTASNGGPYCEGATISLSTATVAGATYSWTGPNGFTSALQNPTRANATTADGGTYSVTVTVNGCTSAAGSTNVVVNATPATPTATNGGPYCQGATISLSTATVAGATYAWTGPNGFTSALQNPTRANATTADSGTYSVTITVNGCTSAAGSTNVVVNAIPATPTASNGGPYCAGATISLSTATVAGATYSWTGPNGFTSSQQNPTRANATTADGGTYSVTITVNGCTSAAGSTNVVVNAIPATPTASNGGPYCAGATISLSTATVAGATYSWTGPNGFTSSQQNPTRANAATADGGTYSVTVTVNGCTSAAGSTSVVVNAAPPTPVITGNTTACQGTAGQLTSSAASGNQWYRDGVAITNQTGTTLFYTQSGSYTVVVTVNGCSSTSAPANVTIIQVPQPTITVSGGPATFCDGGSVTLTSSPASGYYWFNDGSLISGATGQQYVATTSGHYTVRTIGTNNCTSVPANPVTVQVIPLPPVPTISAGGPTTFCAGGSVTLTSSATASNQWLLNGAPISGATGSTYIATTAGDYSVTTNDSGCSSTSSATTVVVNALPNAAITVASPMIAGASGTASVADAGVGATYNWSIANGTINSGAGTRSIGFTAGAAGTLTLNVAVTTAAGCSDAKSANVTVTPPAALVQVTGIVPATGPLAGGTHVTISGSGFQSGATVTFGGVAATNVVVVSGTSITATTPAHAAGAVNVAVTVNSTTGTLTNGFTYAQQFDPNGDGSIDPADIFYLVNYLFLGGPPPAGPAGMLSGDANGDGVVDPADIFYLVNYLFLGGPTPMAVPAQPRSAVAPISGTVTLGTAIVRDGRTFMPVIVTAAPGTRALSLSVRVDGSAQIAAIRRAGAARAAEPVFEVTRRTERGMAWLVSLPSDILTGTVAEIELAAPAGAAAELDLDPSLTMLTDQRGVRKATVANGLLRLRGTTIGRDRATPKPDHSRD